LIESENISVGDFLTDDQYELAEYWNGKALWMSAVSVAHGNASASVMRALGDIMGENCKVLGEPVKVKLADDIFVMPDVFVVCKNGKAVSRGSYIEGPPELVVEVLSPSTAFYDRKKKMDLYFEAGVPEYWIVDISHGVFELWLRGGDRFWLKEVFREGDMLGVGNFGGFIVPDMFGSELF
jgi:Uma2 family endonuclease